jgi:putative Mg2+ transporter-C (MgtC) family protein
MGVPFNVTMTSIRPNHKYFTELTVGKAAMYTMAILYVVGAGLASVLEIFLTIPCSDPGPALAFANPAYDGTRCPHIRHLILMGLTTEECSFGRRLVASTIMGGIVGWERRQADRPAGIRTMSLVSLGSCLFTITSAFAFINGPMNWDSSRISAAIPSGVGFLGAGLIFKKEDHGKSMVVHGLTTAASVWLSAAVGIACGGELYFAASFCVAIMMLLLRFGPRSAEHDDDEDDEESQDIPTSGSQRKDFSRTVVFQVENKKGISRPLKSIESGGAGGYGSTPSGDLDLESEEPQETSSMIKQSIRSVRQRAALASLV